MNKTNKNKNKTNKPRCPKKIKNANSVNISKYFKLMPFE